MKRIWIPLYGFWLGAMSQFDDKQQDTYDYTHKWILLWLIYQMGCIASLILVTGNLFIY